MRRLMVLLVVVAGAGCGEGAATETGATEQFTQGGVSMEPRVKAGQVITARAVTGRYEPRRGDVVVFRSPGGLWGDRKVPLLKRVVAVGGEPRPVERLPVCRAGAGLVGVRHHGRLTGAHLTPATDG